MTIKPEVLAEMSVMDAQWPGYATAKQIIRDELLAMDVEIDRLHSGLAKHVDRVCELSSRLAAADALLREWLSGKWCTPEYDAARQRAYDHLSENAMHNSAPEAGE